MSNIDAKPSTNKKSLLQSVEQAATPQRMMAMVLENAMVMAAPTAILLASQHLSHPGVSFLSVLGGVAVVGAAAVVTVSKVADIFADGEQFAEDQSTRAPRSAIGAFVGAVAAHRQYKNGLQVDVSQDATSDPSHRISLWRPPF